MTYGRYTVEDSKPQREINPVWRGIGCILFIITPITALAVGNVIAATGFIQRYIYIPPSMLNTVTIPGINYTIENFYASLGMAAVITFILFTFYFTVYSALYRVAGPSRYGPKDAPPQRRRKTRKSR